MDRTEILIWIIAVTDVIVVCVFIYSAFLIRAAKKAIKNILAYHHEFAGSHDRLELWVRGINKDMNLIAAAVGDDRKQLKNHDLRVDSLVKRANEIMDIVTENQRKISEMHSENKNPGA